MRTVARFAEYTWAKRFAESVVKQSYHKNWKPYPKQLSAMRGLVSDLFALASKDEGDRQLIE